MRINCKSQATTAKSLVKSKIDSRSFFAVAVFPIVANWANWFHGPNWRNMYYVCQCMPIGPIGSTGPFGAVCTNELMPIGPIGSIGPIGAICNIYANWANWFHGPNWCGMSQ